MRFVIGVVLALSVCIGAYLGSAQVADSAKSPPRRVTLRVGDVAVAGQVQCVAWKETRSGPIRPDYLRCSKGPWNRAAVKVWVTPGSSVVLKKVGQVQCDFSSPYATAHAIFSADLECSKGPRSHAALSVEVLPGGIAVSSRKGKTVYTAGWNPGG